MPIYEFGCAAGHVGERFYPMRATRPKTVKCGSCPRRAIRIFTPTAVRPDFPEHYSWSFGCIVKNRAHHERLQRERGVQDWQPVKEAPQFSNLRKLGHSI